MPGDLPILGVCGWSGAGKTALLEALVPRLRARGLAVAVVKHDVHGLNLDRPGKDSDRLFRAGADVCLASPAERLARSHLDGALDPEPGLRELARRYDLVLVEGHKDTALPKVWLLASGDNAPPAGVAGVLAALAWDSDRVAAMSALLADWLPGQWAKPPVFGCVLIGGQSRRMGRPKHLITTDGRTWLERTVELLRPLAAEVVIAGAGEVPASLAAAPRVPDAPGAQGPMAGVLAAMRWAPWATWLVAACDLPDLSAEALRWLLATRAPGVWATLPRLAGAAGVEPLLAHYDFRALSLIEDLAGRGRWGLAELAADPKVISPAPPPELIGAWRNVNSGS
jgi:molybdopterin-guanine dinucleotide biosynthesis protein MobB